MLAVQVTQSIFPDATWLWARRYGANSPQARNSVCRLVLPTLCPFCPTPAPTQSPTATPTRSPTAVRTCLISLAIHTQGSL